MSGKAYNGKVCLRLPAEKACGCAVVVRLILGVFLFVSGSVLGQDPSSIEPAASVVRGAFQSKPVIPSVFLGDLRNLPKVKPWKPGDPILEGPLRRNSSGHAPDLLRFPVAARRDPLLILQENAPAPGLAAGSFTTPVLNFNGSPNTGVVPPDTNGEIGKTFYIQIVNGSSGSPFTVYDKTNGSVMAGPTNLDSLWTAGGACNNGLGDPIVLYDQLAGRWLMAEFAAFGNHLCVYVSKTNDPVTGGWFNYDFSVPNFPDYHKYAVWPDAYYVSSNEFSPAAYALDRTKMLAGQPATFQRFTATPLGGFGFQALTPSDLDGATPPPVGAPNFFVRHRDDEAHNPGANDPNRDFLEIWQFHADFNNAANSTFGLAATIPVTEFDSALCGLFNFECFPQPGTGTTLDPIREVVMWRSQYRNFATHETLVGNFVTDVNGADHGGIRWFELRRTGGGPWSLFQEGTYAPDANHRWLGSIAMDGSGNMAVGYSVSGSSLFPGIRYVGRESGDAPGTMTTGEAIIINGSASQTFTTRWGDYSSLNVDPVDDCTFWYTNEYVPAGGNWRTRIASFRFPSPICTDAGVPPPVIPAAPLAATGYPHGARKNRYISFAPDPTNAGTLHTYQVTHVGSGASFFISTPRTDGDTPGSVAGLGLTYVVSDGVAGIGSLLFDYGTEPIIHVGGCLIAPGETYEIRATADGVNFSLPLTVQTTAIPTNNRFWSDAVGMFSAGGDASTTPPTPAGSWSPPNGIVNGLDVSAAILGFRMINQPDLTWTDIDGLNQDRITNGNDVLRFVNAFSIGSGLEFYPFPAPGSCTAGVGMDIVPQAGLNP